MLISDLRYELKRVEELESINIDGLPDAFVLLLHDQFATAQHNEAPSWLIGLIQAWLTLEIDSAIDYQHKLEQKDAIINDLQARLNININDYARTG